MTGPAVPPLAVELVRVRVPLLRAHAGAHGTEDHRESVLVGWTAADGTTGWGECPTVSVPGYPTGTTERAWSTLVATLAPAAVAGRTAFVEGMPAAVGALADAALDARLRTAGRSLAHHLGAVAPTVARCAVLAELGREPAAVAARAAAEVAAGAAMVKVKVAPGRDVAVLEAVGSSVDVPVAADANGSYRRGPDLDRLDGLGLAYLEQPLPADTTWDALADCRRSLATPVALDESLTSPQAVRTAALAGAVDVVSVKPARLGGVERAALAVAVAADHGVDAFVGGMFELGIGRAAAAAVAALGGCTLPTDLGPSDRYVATDVCEPVVVDGTGRLVVPDGPGIGRVPDEAAVAPVVVDRVTVHR